MEAKAGFDLQAAHERFSAECFNRAWDLIDKPDRSSEDDRQMLALGMTSLWHWTQRLDHTPENLSVAYWQIARIFTLLDQPGNARVYAQLSLDILRGTNAPPFYTGYAYEALARVEMVAGEKEKVAEYIGLARKISEHITDQEAKKMLLADLATIL